MPKHRSLCLPPTCPASPTVPESGRPNQRVSRKARRGPDRLVPAWALPRDVCSLEHLAPTPLWPQPRSRRQGPAAAQERSRAHADRGQPTAGQDQTGWVSGSRGPDPRERLSSSSGACSVPGAAAAASPPQMLRVRPARGEVILAGRPQARARRARLGGWPRGAHSSSRGGRRDIWLAISEAILWGRLAAKACEMTSTPRYRELSTGSPGLRAETASPGEGRASR